MHASKEETGRCQPIDNDPVPMQMPGKAWSKPLFRRKMKTSWLMPAADPSLVLSIKLCQLTRRSSQWGRSAQTHPTLNIQTHVQSPYVSLILLCLPLFHTTLQHVLWWWGYGSVYRRGCRWEYLVMTLHVWQP